MAFDWEETLGPVLAWFDISGARGSLEIPHRTNLLVMNKEIFFDEDNLVLKVDHFSPEGYGYHRFHSDNLDIPSIEKLQEDIMVVWDVQATMPPIGSLVWVMGVSEIDEFDNSEGFTFQTEDDAFWLPLLNRQISPPSIRLLEFCAGGYGGWKGATTFLHKHCEQRFQTIGIEIEMNACLSYAVAHSAILCHAHDLCRAITLSPDNNFIVCSDIMNTQWWHAACTWNPHVVTISSSCKPWSSAALGQGLGRNDGLLLFKSILLCRFIQPPVICLEQVQGFAVHPHKNWIVRALHFSGYKIAWQGSLDLQDQAPTARIRWLCIAVRVAAQLPCLRVQPWNRILPINPVSEEAVLCCPYGEFPQLGLSPETADLAANPKFHKGSRNRTMTPTEVLKSRINDGHAVTPTFMAMYGSQHELDPLFLENHGYFGHFKAQDDFPFHCRYWRPLEIILLHGHFGDAWIGDSFTLSYLSIGNMIAIPHALFVLLHVANIVGTSALTPFWVFSVFHQHKMRSSTLCTTQTRFGCLVTHQHTTLCEARVSNIVQLFEKFTTNPSSISCWSQLHGLNFGWEDLSIAIGGDANSVVTMPSQITPTCDFVPVLSGLIRSEILEMHFGFSADIPLTRISEHWFDFFGLQPCDDPIESNHVWSFPTTLESVGDSSKTFAIPLLLGKDMTFAGIDEFQNLQHSKIVSRLDCCIFDQFGPIPMSYIPTRDTVLVDVLLQEGDLQHDLPFVFAAIRQVDIEREYVPEHDHFILRFKGPQQPVQVLAELFQNALSIGALEKLGRTVIANPREGMIELIYGHALEGATCPPRAFVKALSVAVIRLLLNNLARQTGTEVDIPLNVKWHGRELWSGKLHPNTRISILVTLLGSGVVPIEADSPIRLMNWGLSSVRQRIHSNPFDVWSSRWWSQ